MTEITTPAEALRVTVRFFAAARDAAGADSADVSVSPGSTVADLISELCCQSDTLALVLQKCSFLCDGVAVRDPAAALRSHQIIDVLPPFAGG